jgi:hypothetical protein
MIFTDLNEEDKNIKEIIEEKKIPEINCSREMLQLFQRNTSIIPASNCF